MDLLSDQTGMMQSHDLNTLTSGDRSLEEKEAGDDTFMRHPTSGAITIGARFFLIAFCGAAEC